jgi:site-specific DNA recombinase
MTKFYGYIRVSTAKQEKGVSLEEQRDAIRHFAERQGLQITEWFEEVLTAAKKGRPLFAEMIRGLKRGRANGVIMHKIDRSARNLRDWLELGDLIDSGEAVVHFVNENIDLRSRGGRLSADIQAVIAADYIRNLREEARKGLYGRLKQGVYPFCAPPGYKNTGPGGRLKTIDPSRAPFVRQAFELYASGRYTLDSLLVELRRRGFRNRNRRPILRSSLALILNNPFYAGVIRIRTTGETFKGKHEPLISMALFNQVQDRLSGRVRMHGLTHDFPLRGLFRCELCNRQLTGERQKGHVYYRCHGAACPTRGFREEVLEDALIKSWTPIAISGKRRDALFAHLEHILEQDAGREVDRASQLQLQITGIANRLTRLIDALVDGALDKESFEIRKRALLEEEQSLKQSLESAPPSCEQVLARVARVFELACTAQQSYLLASPQSKRELTFLLTSNRTVAGKDVHVEPYFPLAAIGEHSPIYPSGDQRHIVRTFKNTCSEILEWAKAESMKTEDQRERLPTPMERAKGRRIRLRPAA